MEYYYSIVFFGVFQVGVKKNISSEEKKKSNFSAMFQNIKIYLVYFVNIFVTIYQKCNILQSYVAVRRNS